MSIAHLPTAHVLHDFRLDLPLAQVQREDRFLPGRLQCCHVQLGQLQKLALGCKRATREQDVDVRMSCVAVRYVE